jgi:hypothetical protein
MIGVVSVLTSLLSKTRVGSRTGLGGSNPNSDKL